MWSLEGKPSWSSLCCVSGHSGLQVNVAMIGIWYHSYDCHRVLIELSHLAWIPEKVAGRIVRRPTSFRLAPAWLRLISLRRVQHEAHPDTHVGIEAGFARTEPMHRRCTPGTIFRSDELWRIGWGENGDNKNNTVIVRCGLNRLCPAAEVDLSVNKPC